MVAGEHDGALEEVFGPDLGRPVSDGEEELGVAGVALHLVNGAVMSSLLDTEPLNIVSGFTLVDLDNVTLLSSNQELQRRMVRVVLKTGTSIHFGQGLFAILGHFLEDDLLSRLFVLLVHLSVVPPEHATVGGCRNTFTSSFTNCDPRNVVNGVVMTVFEPCGAEWFS